MKGQLEIICTDEKTGEVVSHEKHDNMVLQSMYTQLTRLLGGEASGYANKIQLGTGGGAPFLAQDKLDSPITPMLDGTQGTNFVVEFNDVDCEAVFIGVLPSDKGNGFTLREAGLVSNENILLARSTFTGRVKSVGYIFTFVWTIKLRGI